MEEERRVTAVQSEQDPMLTLVRSRSADAIAIRNEGDTGINLTTKLSLGSKPEANIGGACSQLLVDVDLLAGNSSGSSRETDRLVASRAFSGSLGSSAALAPLGALDTSQLKNHHGHGPMENEQTTTYKNTLRPDTSNEMQIEPTFPIFIKFSDVSYKVRVKGERRLDVSKYILHGVTGSVNPGELLALMGPSGGGKTTLLNLLSGRVNIKDRSGIITYNDQRYSKWLRRRIGFVLQDDVVFPHLTVRETLTYAALLRLPRTLTKQQKVARATNVIFKLGLDRCQDTIIGGASVRGISGGERKRVCIGNEILLDPSLLFLDEPTSGLDSTTALGIFQMLQNIADAGKTVISTVHQPSSRLFNTFDKLILLGRGSSLYFGNASDAMKYFSSIGWSPLMPMNPAEFLIDLANGNINDKSIPSEVEVKVRDSKERGRCLSSIDICEYLVGVYSTRFADREKKKLLKPVPVDSRWEMQGGSRSRKWGASWGEQCCILFRRGLKERRHDYLSCIRVTQVLSAAIIVGLLWWHSDASSPRTAQDQAGLLFFIAVFWGFFPVFTAISTFPQERAMLVKERSVDMYKLSAYFMARYTSDLLLDLILPVVFLLIVYFMVGLKPEFSIFLKSLLTIFLSIIAAQGLGLAIGAALMDVKKATTLASVVIMSFMLAGGFFAERVPHFMSWIRYLSPNFHTYRLLLKIQYGCSNLYQSGSELGLDGGEMEAGAMVAMVFGYRLLAYLFLRGMKLRI